MYRLMSKSLKVFDERSQPSDVQYKGYRSLLAKTDKELPDIPRRVFGFEVTQQESEGSSTATFDAVIKHRTGHDQ